MHPLISADSHVTIPEEAWQQYLSPQYREQAPRIESTEDGDVRVFQGERSKIIGLGNVAGKKPEEYKWNVRRLSEMRSGASDPVERIKDQDIDGIDAEVLYFGGPILDAKDDLLRLDSYRGYNQWLADYCSTSPKRLLGIADIPVDNPDIAISHIKDAATLGLRGVVLPLFPPDDDYAAPRWEPMWKTAVELDLPVALHIGNSLASGQFRRRGQPVKLATHAATFMTGFVNSKMAMTEALSELIFGGVLERNPELNIISVEAQIGWMSFFTYYIDHLWNKHRFHTQASLKEYPSFYCKRQVVATFMEDPVGLRERHEIGVDNIMWASDYPHSETTWPNSKSLIDEWFSSFGEEEKEKITWKNAARIFRWEP